MYAKQLSLIFLLPFICVAWADIDSSVETTVNSEIRNVTEDVLHLSRTCVSDSDCANLGRCEVGIDGKFCKCKNGTRGNFCEEVVECVDNPAKCGTSNDASCVFDLEEEKAVCKCANENKTYIEDEEICSTPCYKYYDCGPHGACMYEVGNRTFCACYLGTSGDFCEIIDQCHSKEVDCGVDNNATCTLGGRGKAYCKCDDKTKGFDYDEKTCKGCEGCGENIYSIGSCSYRDGIRRCSCRTRYYSSENGTCEDCKCGQGGHGCKFENGTKICQCWGGYANKDGYCQKCDCGSGIGVSNCEFKDGKKICTCRDGYALERPDGPCKQMCNATNPCENGGKCVQNACNCLKGTSGHFCKTIDDCSGRWKCGFANCLYNVTSKEAYCKCDGSLTFDDYSKTCKECNCGSYSRSCAFVEGKKRCNCMDVYADRLGTCALCYCKGASSMYGCKFDDYGSMKCRCLKGYAQKGDECQRCDCGDHGKCELYGWSKVCSCDVGYSELNGKCEECDCGKKGSCYFYSGKKTCSCPSGYKEYKGTCQVCKCGNYAICGFNQYGTPECTCQNGYGMNYGVCTYCDCGIGYSCRFTGNNNFKTCICPNGYIEDNGKCKACDCKIEGSKCSFKNGFNRCLCPAGFEEKYDPDKAFNKICVEINVCKNSNPCPPSSTDCVNGKTGSYECVCKTGYEALYYDVENRGCQDIDECVRNYKPCDDDDAVCVNTPGSYRCDCKAGYIRRDKEEKKNICHVDFSRGSGTRPWRTGSIIVGVSSAIIVIGLLFAICHKYGHG